MAWHTWDAAGWYAGTAEDEGAACTSIEPPTLSTTTTPGEPRARWHRYEWRTEPYSAGPVPVAVPMASALVVMLRAGITEEAITAAINAMPDAQANAEALLMLRRSHQIRRQHPLVLALGPALGLTTEQVDDLFRAAAAL